MNGLRLALVTRRFWPLVGSEETALSDLAVEFQRQGAAVRILTAQWHAAWPSDVVHREVPIIRLRKPPQIGWGILRYMMALSRYVRKHAEELDLVYVSHMHQDAYSIIGALEHTPIPVVLRSVGIGVNGDSRWQERTRFGSRIRKRCQRADAIVAPNSQMLEELTAAGYGAERLFQIGNGVEEFAARDAQRRLSARAALGSANSDLAADDDTPVAVCVGRLLRSKGVFELLRAWRPIVACWPNAKLWFIGDGPDRDELYDAVLEYELRDNVALPGVFDDVRDVLQAADLCVLPSQEDSPSVMTLFEAMSAGTPILASNIVSHRALVRSNEHALLFPAKDHLSITNAIMQTLDNPKLAATRVAAAKTLVRERYSIERSATAHLELFERLVFEKRERC